MKYGAARANRIECQELESRLQLAATQPLPFVSSPELPFTFQPSNLTFEYGIGVTPRLERHNLFEYWLIADDHDESQVARGNSRAFVNLRADNDVRIDFANASGGPTATFTTDNYSRTVKLSEFFVLKVLLGFGEDTLVMSDPDGLLKSRVLIKGGPGEDGITIRMRARVKIDGGTEADRISTGPGRDTVRGGEGNDTIAGGDGPDVLDGGQGFDVISGNGGNDTIIGGGAADTIDAGAGKDVIFGDEDNTNDNASSSGFDGDFIKGGEGSDTIRSQVGNDFVEGGGGADSILSGSQVDTVYGGDGGDTIRGGLDNDLIYGDRGNDELFGEQGNVEIISNRADQEAAGNPDTILGGPGDDLIRGEISNDELYGGDGNDTVFGDYGKDKISGGPGDDSVKGGEARDTVLGDGGNDIFNEIDFLRCDGVDENDRLPRERLKRFLGTTFFTTKPNCG